MNNKVEQPKMIDGKVVKSSLGWKVKTSIASLAVFAVYVTGISTLHAVNSFFRHYEFKFEPIVEFNYPVQITARKNIDFISPVPDDSFSVNAAELTPTPTPIEKNDKVGNVLRGEASYYSREGCVGCSETLTMANGEPLDDDAYTIALPVDVVRQYRLMNQSVRIQNPKTTQTVIAQVTDTGGFDKLGRIADMTPAVRDALMCQDLCEIEIFF